MIIQDCLVDVHCVSRKTQYCHEGNEQKGDEEKLNQIRIHFELNGHDEQFIVRLDFIS